MALVNDLEKLAELLQSGVLTQAEFEKAKLRLLEDRPLFTRPSLNSDPEIERMSPGFRERLRQAEADELAAAILSKYHSQRLTMGIITLVILLVILAAVYPFMVR